jgi:L-rhamnose mutarotase
MRKYCLALDLKDDIILIQEYIEHHKKVWKEIEKSISDSGILDLEIYNIGNRLFMIMKVDKSFSFEKKQAADNSNPKVLEWEKLMWKYQQKLPFAQKGEKWVLMDKVYQLKEQ